MDHARVALFSMAVSILGCGRAHVAAVSAPPLRHDQTRLAPRMILADGHSGPVSACSKAAGPEWIATGGRDGTVRLWTHDERRESAVFHAHAGRVEHVAVNRDGNLLASAGRDGMVKVWMLDSGETFERQIADPRWPAGFFAPAADDLAVSNWQLIFDGEDGLWLAESNFPVSRGEAPRWRRVGRKEGRTGRFGFEGAPGMLGFSTKPPALAADYASCKLSEDEAKRFESPSGRWTSAVASTRGNWVVGIKRVPAALEPDLHLVAFPLRGSENVARLSVESEQLAHVVDTDGGPVALFWEREGNASLRMHALSRPHAPTTLALHDGDGALAVAPAVGKAIVVRDDRSVQVVDVVSGTTTSLGQDASAVATTSDMKRVAWIMAKGSLVVWHDSRQSELPASVPDRAVELRFVDTSWLAVRYDSGRVRLWDLERSRPHDLSTGIGCGIVSGLEIDRAPVRSDGFLNARYGIQTRFVPNPRQETFASVNDSLLVRCRGGYTAWTFANGGLTLGAESTDAELSTLDSRGHFVLASTRSGGFVAREMADAGAVQRIPNPVGQLASLSRIPESNAMLALGSSGLALLGFSGGPPAYLDAIVIEPESRELEPLAYLDGGEACAGAPEAVRRLYVRPGAAILPSGLSPVQGSTTSVAQLTEAFLRNSDRPNHPK